jgi:F0F1-type ATP synthase assembly protein I
MYIGNFLDNKYAKTPIFTLIGTFLGMGIGFYHLIRTLVPKKSDEQKSEQDDSKNDENDKNDEKVKWL